MTRLNEQSDSSSKFSRLIASRLRSGRGNHPKTALLLFPLVLTATPTCAPQDASKQAGANSQGVIVPRGQLFDGRELVVCWSTTHPSMSSLRSAVESHVVSNFARLRGLRVKPNWQPCAKLRGEFDISVFFYDDPAFRSSNELSSVRNEIQQENSGAPGSFRVREWGKALRGKPFGVILNATNLDRPNAVQRWESLSPNGKKNYVISSALHEFGHAVGLKHEHGHPDSTCSLFDEDMGRAIAVTKYDPQSIMNYCQFAGEDTYNPALDKGLLGFSAGDVATLNAAYPGQPARGPSSRVSDWRAFRET